MRFRGKWGAWRLGVLLLAASIPIGGCERGARGRSQVNMSWTLTPAKTIVGPATLNVTLRTPSGDPVKGAAVHLECHMTHAGMAPILADATERAPGDYQIPFVITMRGDWVLLVSATLPDGTRVERRIDVANVQPSE